MVSAVSNQGLVRFEFLEGAANTQSTLGFMQKLVAINADGNPYDAHFDAGCGRAVDLITGADHDFGGGSTLEPYSCHFWKCER